MKATVEGEEISVAWHAEDGELVLEVSDYARGIRAEALDRVFERFSKIDPDRARNNGGTGFGLSFAKAIVEAHGGLIAVESEEGRGTTFRIRVIGFRPVTA